MPTLCYVDGVDYESQSDLGSYKFMWSQDDSQR